MRELDGSDIDRICESTMYSDGPIEMEILTALRRGKAGSELLREDNRWPVFYHFSPLRGNIVSWLRFPDNADVLEVGSGMGAITGTLCDMAGNLTCVDISPIRNEINRLRHGSRRNLQILTANIMDMDWQCRFDVITMIGVLEYGGKFSQGSAPFSDLLRHIGSQLAPGGMLVLAIENRMGLKYLAGAKEDHYNVPFAGIENYPNYNGIRTFTKIELHDLLIEAGFDDLDFYLPSPDYKFPVSIVSESASEFHTLALEEERNYGAYDVRPFNQRKVSETMVSMGIYPEFSNSFLVLAKHQSCGKGLK